MTRPLLQLATVAALLLMGCDERPAPTKPVQHALPASVIHDTGTRQFSVVETPQSFPFDCYPVDLVRRVNASGAPATMAVIRLGPGASNDAIPATPLAIDDLPAIAKTVKVSPGSKLNLELDFGAPFVISSVRLHFVSRHVAPREVKLFSEDSRLLASASDIEKVAILQFPPTRLRRVRVELTAASDKRTMRIPDINVFPASNGPVPTVADGFSITQLPEVVQTVTDGKRSSRRRSVVDLKPGTGEAGQQSDVQPRVLTLDLGSDFAVQQLRFTFQDWGRGMGAWEHGARVEVRASATETWNALVDSTTPFTSNTVTVSGRKLRYVRITNKLREGGGTGTGRLLDVAVIPPVVEHTPPKPIFELPANKNAVAGVSVFDSQGHLLRTLVRARRLRSTATPVYFDGRDDLGRTLPPGTYRIRTAVSEIRSRTVGAVGSKPPGAPDKIDLLPHSAGTGDPNAVVSDRNGNIFIGSRFEESDVDLRRVSADGREIWSNNTSRVAALAVDESKGILYVATSPGTRDLLSRVTIDRGTKAAFDNGVEQAVINPDSSFGVAGLAVDSRANGLFVSNRKQGRIEIWDAQTGQPLVTNALKVDDPRAIVVDPVGSKLWVASKQGVRRFRFERAPAYRILPQPELTVSGLQDPFGLAIDAWNDPPKRLLVSDRGPCQVREFRLDANRATPGGAFERFGHCRSPGPLEDRAFFWRNQGKREDWPHLALAPNGTLVVTDRGNRRVQAFNSTGALQWTTFSEYVPSVEVEAISPTQHRLLTGGFQYSVDTSAIERDPAHGALRWQRTHNWEPDDGSYFRSSYFSPSMRRRLKTPKGPVDFLYSLYDRNVISVFKLENDRPKRVAAMGWSWHGATGMGPREPAIWSWHDKDSDQRIDFEAAASESDEVDFQPIPHGFASKGKAWVNREGGIVIGFEGKRELKGARVVTVPIARWDPQEGGNPIPVYDWRRRETLVDSDTLGRGASRLGTAALQPFFSLETSKNLWFNMNAGRAHAGVLNSSGAGFLSVNRATKAISAFPALDDRTSAMAVDAAPLTLWYEAASGGPGYWIYVRDADGLPLFRIDAGAIPGVQEGWIDNTSGLGVVGTGASRYVYAEAVYAGSVMVHHLTGIDTIQYTDQLVILEPSR